MTNARFTAEDTAAAKQAWESYVEEHDLSQREGQTAGIDPRTGRIWFGDSIPDVIAQRDADGFDSPLRFERVGSSAYFRKGAHR